MPDATLVETIVIKATELARAVEGSERNRSTVLRVTAPFSPRMRARLHVEQQGDPADSRQVLLDPQELLVEGFPPLPQSDETAELLTSRPDETYGVDRHRELHAEAVAEWREQITEYVADRVTVPAFDGSVRLSLLASAGDE